MFTAAAFCPHPPLLAPALASGAADELDDLRGACGDALEQMLRSRPELVVCVGLAPRSAEWGQHAAGSLRRYGVDVRAGANVREATDHRGPAHPRGGRTEGDPELPLALTMGAWLLDRAGWFGGRRYVGVADEGAPSACARLGADVVDSADRVALLVMGDGSARRSANAPGNFDDRATGYDDAVAEALSTADGAALLRLTPRLAEELMVAGRAPWQVAAGALATVAAEHSTAQSDVGASLRYAKAPYGVGYVVATWSRRGA